MNNEQLQQLVEQISVNSFNKPFQHDAYFNNRLRTTGGRYSLADHHIEINPKHYEHFGYEELVKIIKHELCHYHLHIEGKGYMHKDREFKNLLKAVGGSRHCQTLPGTRKKSKVIHMYQCTSCDLIYKRKRRIDTKKYVCGKCKGKLKIVKTISG
ncbi:SprT family protein [Bacillus shivajii]|uniref:SprT family protein n=1 Tax=Bacillus shivajii TaxID=1983719 RepID=UPI001CFA327F|nr:SprT family protein [Bacillus shivajii]UCZ53695.1 SprT family protein [Bacillus shivajii]